jgi:cell division protein FtsI (penicillin-binding protein 3)
MVTKHYEPRMGLVFLGICFVYLIIIARLIILQIIEHNFYLALAGRQYITTLTYVPPRAMIYDRNQVPLAVNHTYQSACIFPKTLRNAAKTKNFLEQHFPQAAERLNKHLGSSFMFVQRRLNEEQQALINQSDNEDIYIIDEPGRYYPLPYLGTVIGITSIDQEGAFGLELQYDAQLRGTPSNTIVQRDARNGRRCYFAKTATSRGEAGIPLVTTLDSTLQFFAHEELLHVIKEFNATEGSVIIMDPANGDILAMVNYPFFDPNNTTSLDMHTAKNRSISETYEFGSVIKVFLALAALDTGVVTPDTLIDCHNAEEIVLQGMRISTWKAHGSISFAEVISGSNNIGTAQVARQIGTDLYNHYIKCGFGKSYHILPGEQAGHVTHPSTWSLQTYASLSYGYEIRATLLQLACAWCMIARNGVQVLPRLIQPTKNSMQIDGPTLYSPKVVQQLADILEKTVQKGTAHRAHIKGYKILGKTGSARLCIDGHYQQNRGLYTFAGIVSKGSYQRVIATYIKEAKGKKLFASTVAAPLFERITERMLIHEGVLNSSNL